jgi:hypothetical protein
MNGSRKQPKKVTPDYHPTIKTVFGSILSGVPADFTGIPTAICPCGYSMFIACVQFDEIDKTIEYYILDGVCALCGSLVTLPSLSDETTGMEIDYRPQLDDEDLTDK